MTRPETDDNMASEVTTRRSTRRKTEPVATKAPIVAKSRSAGRTAKKPVSAEGIDSGEDEEEEESRARASRSAKPKNAPVKSTTGQKKPQRVPTKDVEDQALVGGAEDDEDDEEEESEEEGDADDVDDIEPPSASEVEDDDDSDFEEPLQKKQKAKSEKKPKAPKVALTRIPVIKRSTKAPKESKARKAANPSKSTKTAKSSAKGSAQRKSAEDAVEGEEEEEEEEETSVLYSAVLDSQTALDGVVEEWIEEYEKSNEDGMMKLINFLLRCCGCTQLISAEDFSDDDIVETLEGVLLRYKENTSNFDYPIISKAKEFKKFKKNLLEFYTRLIQKIQNEIMFDKYFMGTFLSWTISLSDTTFRPVRHTATVVGLSIVSLLAEVASEIQDELNITSRQLATNQKQKSAQIKIRQLEKKLKEGKDRQASVLQWINEIFESVFVLRCRDVDPQVRADCVRELGQWMTINPEHFIASSFLQYLGWLLSDKTAAVRVETLKVLAKLYESENQANALRQFTTRFTDRFVEMAWGESDTSARQGAIRVATLIHKHGQLEEEDQVKLSVLIFGANAKVRKSLAKFVKARVFEDEVEGRMASCEVVISSQSEKAVIKKDWVELKSLVSFLIKAGKAEEEQIASGNKPIEQGVGSHTHLIDETKVGRIALAVEALWVEIEALKSWKSIAEYLIEDHSTAPAQAASSQSKAAKATTLENIYHLEEEEENILLEIFIASLQLTVHPPAVPGFQKDKAKLKAQQDELANEVGRFCVGVLPQLFSKYGVDSVRIRSVLVIPQLIPLNVYLDMRLLTTYEELVDEVIKVFKKHTDTSVLLAASATLRVMLSHEMLRTSHEAKIETLGASLVESLLVQTSVEEEMSNSDTLDALVPCLRRLEYLIKCTDLTGKRTRSTVLDPFDSLLKVIDSNKTARGEHAEVLISALSIAFLWISWVCRGVAFKSGPDADWTEQDASDILEKQGSLLRVASELTTRGVPDVDTRVRRRAFQVIGDMYWLFGGDMFHVTKGANRHLLYLACPESTQVECEDFVLSEIDLWVEKVQEKMATLQEARKSMAAQNKRAGTADEEEDDNDNESNLADVLEDEKQAAAQVEQEEKHEMFGTVFSFMRQIILKDFSMEHATTVLAQFGRFGVEFDEGVKRVVTAIKAQTSSGMSKQMRAQKAETFMSVCLESLKKAFEIFLDGHVKSTSQSLHLAKVLMNAIKPPGFMQQVRIGIDAHLIWRLHSQGVVYIIEKLSGCKGIDNRQRLTDTAKFFEILNQMLFGVQAAAGQVATVKELITTEAEKHGLTIDDEEETVWEPLRSYQSKLEKLSQKAIVEEAAKVRRTEEAAVAAAAAATAAQVGDQVPAINADDVEMEAVERDDQLVANAQISGIGKKRGALSDDEANDEEEEEQVTIENEGTEKRRTRSPSASDAAAEATSGLDSGAESDSSFRSLTIKESKRIRLA